MPAKSLAQLRLMFAKGKRGEVPKGTALEFAHKTPNISELPKYVKHAKGGEVMRHYAHGGERYGLAHGGLPRKMDEGGEVDPYAAELYKRMLIRKKGMAHGGTVDNYMGQDEEDYDHGVERERYEPETAEHFACGGMAECPSCGHKFAHGGMAEESSALDANEHDYAGGNYRQQEGMDGQESETQHMRRFAHALRARHAR